MSDISKIINDSIASVVSEGAIDKVKEKYKEVIDDMASGKAAEIVYDKLHPEKTDVDFEMSKKLANVRADKLLKAEEAAREASNAEHAERATVGHHAKEYANELWSKTKKFGQDNFTLDPDKIDLPKTGMTGAAIAAGLGALALRRRMKKAQKGQ